jgi:C-terminal processing protease CtpA/Prc
MKKIVMMGAAVLVLSFGAFAAHAQEKPAPDTQKPEQQTQTQKPAPHARKPVRHARKPPVPPQLGLGTSVDEVVANSAAATAGIRQGDVILGINGKPINTYLDIAPIVAASGGRPMAMEIDRAGTRVHLKVTARRSTEPAPPGSAQRWLLGINHAETASEHGPDSGEPVVTPPAPAAPPPNAQ